MKCWKWPMLLLVPILTMCLGTACSKSGNAASQGTILPVPDAKSENGWPLYEVPAEGFALALPPDWRQFDMNPATFETSLKESLNQNPEFEAMQGNLRQQVTAGIKFFGIDKATINTGFATNVNVLRLPAPPGATLDMAVADTLKQMDGMPNFNKPIIHERLKMASGDAERFRYTMTMQSPSGKIAPLSMMQFILVKGSHCYVMTMTTLPDVAAKYEETFEKIGQSFRIIK